MKHSDLTNLVKELVAELVWPVKCGREKNKQEMFILQKIDNNSKNET